jgi:hypothetical protein
MRNVRADSVPKSAMVDITLIRGMSGPVILDLVAMGKSGRRLHDAVRRRLGAAPRLHCDAHT